MMHTDGVISLSAEICDLCSSPILKDRKRALELLRYNFPSLINNQKQLIWDDIVILSNDADFDLSRDSSSVLRSILEQNPHTYQSWDRQKAWNNLFGLINSKKSYTRESVASVLGLAFLQLQDKTSALMDIHTLSKSPHTDIKQGVASSLSYVIPNIQQVQEAWEDLHLLISDDDTEVRRRAVITLYKVFRYIPSESATEDLHRLTSDESAEVRKEVAIALGQQFSRMSNSQQSLLDLFKLTEDDDSDVRSQANYSLGRAFIFYTSNAKTNDEYLKKLDKAIDYFSMAEREAFYDWLNPAKVCRPYYMAFRAIISGQEKDVEMYLDETEDALEGTLTKEQFKDIIDHLRKALNEIRSLGNCDLATKIKILKIIDLVVNSCRLY